MSSATLHNPVASGSFTSSKKPAPVSFMRQSDPLWATTRLGTSKVSIAKAGCLLTTYAEALRALSLDELATPLTINKAAIAAKAYVGAGLIQATLARAVGLILGEAITDIESMKRELSTNGVDRLHILHVDHGGKSTAPDHFILGLAVDVAAGVIQCADPATGLPCKLSLASLTGPALWANKTYAVRSVRCVSKRQAARDRASNPDLISTHADGRRSQ